MCVAELHKDTTNWYISWKFGYAIDTESRSHREFVCEGSFEEHRALLEGDTSKEKVNAASTFAI